MKRLGPIVLLAALPMAYGACSDSSAPEGRPGTLTVRSSVDRDASGSLTAADSVLAGMSLTITASDGSTTRTVTTNSAGVFGIVVDTISFGTADASGQVSVLGTNAQGVLVFEPRSSRKGDVARAIFYFYTRYKLAPTPSFSLANFNIEEPVLRQWAQQDPPDDFERARNNLVFRVQLNRNPFIDRPDFLTAIGDFPNE